VKKIGLVMGLLVLLTACVDQYASNGEQQYVYSHNGVIPVVPPPLTAANISNFYDLPAQNQNAKVSVTPPTDEA